MSVRLASTVVTQTQTHIYDVKTITLVAYVGCNEPVQYHTKRKIGGLASSKGWAGLIVVTPTNALGKHV